MVALVGLGQRSGILVGGDSNDMLVAKEMLMRCCCLVLS